MQERKLRLIRSVVGAALMLGVATPLFWIKFGTTYGALVLVLGGGMAYTAIMQAIAYRRLKRKQEEEKEEDRSE